MIPEKESFDMHRRENLNSTDKNTALCISSLLMRWKKIALHSVT